MKYTIKQFPHCDSKILHAPLSCEYCDMHPEWQELRIAWDIAFTGQKDKTRKYKDWDGKDKVKILQPCPSEVDRPIEVINKWHGNVPQPTKSLHDQLLEESGKGL